MPSSVLTSETCHLSINYAYVHLFLCLLQVPLLYLAHRMEHFKVAHAFGLFAFAMDYCLNHLTTGTRTIQLDSDSLGQEALGPIGTFLFFVWFDYSAFGILVWAIHVEEALKDSLKKSIRGITDVVLLSFIPLQFWLAPIIEPQLTLDTRTLVLTRSSNKYFYLFLLLTSTLTLSTSYKLKFREIASILVSGFCCGLCHHGALVYHGMRGYSDYASLLITLCTEWPALIATIGVMRRSNIFSFITVAVEQKTPTTDSTTKAGKGTIYFTTTMYLLIASLLFPHLSSITEDHFLNYVIPFVPGKHMQTIGTGYFRLTTCSLPHYIPQLFPRPNNCFENEDSYNDMLVLASAAKSGAVLAAKIAMEVGGRCGICVASPERSRAGIPGPVEELPVYEGNFLLAIVNNVNWPEYAENYGFDVDTLKEKATDAGGSNKKVKCVTLVRDPLSRLRSLYTYARSGGEHWFRIESGRMAMLNDKNITLQQSLDLYWELFGRDYLVQSHNYINLNLQLGCTGVKMEEFHRDFNGTLTKVLDVYGIKKEIHPEMLSSLSVADSSLMTESQKNANPHLSSLQFSKEVIKEITRRFMEMGEVKRMVEEQRVVLGY